MVFTLGWVELARFEDLTFYQTGEKPYLEWNFLEENFPDSFYKQIKRVSKYEFLYYLKGFKSMIFFMKNTPTFFSLEFNEIKQI